MGAANTAGDSASAAAIEAAARMGAALNGLFTFGVLETRFFNEPGYACVPETHDLEQDASRAA
jgi:hypothetical protein